MSQAGSINSNGAIIGSVLTLTGNSGGAVGPDGTGNIDVLGNNPAGINIVGNSATNTLTVTAAQATTIQQGTVLLATNAEAIAGTDTSNAVTSAALAAKLGTQTAHSLALFQGSTSALTPLGVAGNGQIPIGSVGADPVLANITSTGGTITVTNGPGTINIDLAGGHTAIEQFLPDSGTTPVVPNGSGQVTMAGSGSTITVGGPNSLTFQLTGLIAHSVLVGAGTPTITKVGPTATVGQVLQSAGIGADPAFSTAAYPLTTTINEILYSSSANTVTGLATANRAVLTTGATGVPVLTAIASDGQIIVGSTAGVPAAATLTPGAGISITNGSNSITIAATGAGFTWSDQSGAFAAAVENGYFITATSTATLPASPNEGDTIAFIVDTTQILTITANTGQVIRIGSAVSASAGTAASNARGDSVELVFRATGASWIALSVIGTWTVT